MLGAGDIRRLATSLGVTPARSRGQHFVVDANTVRRIAARSRVGPGDRVLEVGPGLGSLTLALAQSGAQVLAVEVDPVLAQALPATVFARLPQARVEVVCADALALGPADLPGAPPTALVANLPYNIAVPVLLGLLERLPSVQTGLVMVQAEVGHRLAAPPGSRVYGVPSVKAAWWCEVAVDGAVSRSVFWPAPHVDSVLVSFHRRDQPGDEGLRRAVWAVVEAAFAQRRKTLRAALAGWAGSPAAAERRLRAAGIDPAVRGETLPLAAFVALAGTPTLGQVQPEEDR